MTPSRSQILRGLAISSGLFFQAAFLHAGDIVGRVTIGTAGSKLPAASVTLVGTDRTTVSNNEGWFNLTDVPQGSATVRVDYAGYDSNTQTVTVPATGAVTVAVRIGEDVVRLDKMVVGGYREGRSRAIQQKLTGSTISDIISADSIGNLPDRNVSEAAARMPGVTITGIDQGEGVYVSIRRI